MKKLINAPNDVAAEALEGFASAHADIVVLSDGFIKRPGTPSSNVAVISGGGSGHEPLHIGFVGAGMLDAAIPGHLFTSPPPRPILDAITAVDGGAGVLQIVKNYTGDVLSFETAAELAQANDVNVSTVVVRDDVAVEESTFTAGRRGVAGTLVVEKIAGAAAQRGYSLDEVTSLAQRTADSVRSMGLALDAGIVPTTGMHSFDLPPDEVEFGVGIHGEPGRARIAMEDADSLTERLVTPILDDFTTTVDEDSAQAGDCLLLVNGLGATTPPELYIVYRKARQIIESRGWTVTRSLVGTYVTSLDMHGVSITVAHLDDELTELWDDPVHTAAMRW